MKIETSNIGLYAKSKSIESTSIELQKINQEKPTQIQIKNLKLLDDFGISLEKKIQDPLASINVEGSKMYEISEADYQKVQMLEKILSSLTGKEVKFILPRRLEVKSPDGSSMTPNGSSGPDKAETTSAEARQPYYRKKVHYQHEQSMSFKASGKVTTSDGREIEFDLKLQRQSSFSFKSEMTLDKNGKAVDPLVINYNGSLSELTQQKYEFDLDFNGTKDQISFLQKGSGYLSIDLNENGKIDDGRELFGPTKGNGFEELKAYDQDSNGWIDENDEVFSKLRIWNKNEEGQDVLMALGEVGVGAIYLGHVATDYALGQSPLSPDGYIRQTGIFLKESGSVGTIHHVDLSL